MKKVVILIFIIFLSSLGYVFAQETTAAGFGVLEECERDYNCVGPCGNGYECSEDGGSCECITPTCLDSPYKKECASGYYCNPSQNACISQLDFGEFCNENYECQSGICNPLTSPPRQRYLTSKRITGLVTAQPIFETTQIYTNTGKICIEDNRWIGSCSAGCSEDRTGCLEGSRSGPVVLRSCETSYYCNPSENACVQQKLSGEECSNDRECRSLNCHDTENVCISQNNWIGSCKSGTSCSADRTRCDRPGGPIMFSFVCAQGFYCEENSCVDAKDDGESCTLNNECSSNRCTENVCSGCESDLECEDGFTCSENRCTSIPCLGVICSEGKICNPMTNACEEFTCAADFECGIGYSCEEGSCIPEEEIVPVQRCSTTVDCEENLVCTLSPGEGGICSECTTEDIDSDGILDCSREDLCVGSTINECLSGDLGLSCASIRGIVCDGVCGDGSDWSTVSTELNCCYSETGTAACESNPIYISELRTSVALRKNCNPDGRAEIEIVDSVTNLRILDRDTLLLTGLSPSGQNPYIDTTDYSCSNIDLGASTAGADVPGYGLISFLLTISLLLVFYAIRKH